jgi:formamidopyrimidine-DNA glycosylase
VPELPEVETIRRQIEPAIEGRVLKQIKIRDPRWCEPLAPTEIADAVERRVIEAVSRRGKYLIFEFEDEVYLLMHLRMTGTILIDPPDDPRYERVRLYFSGGRTLHFCDPRRFGTGQLVLGGRALDDFLAERLGIEPLGDELTGARLRALAAGRRAPIKAFLLDQRRIAGVGNIYADEALFRAHIHPLRPAGSLSRTQYELLAQTVRDSLTAGLDAGGATIDDFRHPDGVSGAFQNEFLVHLRKGEPCVNCGRTIVKFVAAGRGTYACEHCQPKPRAARRTVL